LDRRRWRTLKPEQPVGVLGGCNANQVDGQEGRVRLELVSGEWLEKADTEVDAVE
jgi:hypothetical protein